MLYAMYATDFSRAFFGLDRTPVAGHVRVYKMRKGRKRKRLFAIHADRRRTRLETNKCCAHQSARSLQQNYIIIT